MKTLEIDGTAQIADVRRFKLQLTRETRNSYVALCILLWTIIAYLLISHFIMMRVEIKGISMSPTLLDGQRYMLFRAPYLWRAPQKGEIVVIRDPEDHDLSIKRIIATPGDLLEIHRDGVYVNHNKISETYLTADALQASGHKLLKPTVMGPKDYFVLGDNRDWSADSRIYGAVPRNFILGCISRPK